MDAGEINAIRDLSHTELTNRLLEKDTKDGVRLVVLPKDYMVSDLEKYQPKPSMFRGLFRTESFKDFVAYTNSNLNDHSRVFVYPDKFTALAILDMGTIPEPEWGKHRAKLTLKKTAEFAAVLDMAGKNHKQLELVDFIEDFSENVIFQDGMSQAILAIRNMTVTAKSEKESNLGDFKSTASKYDEIEVKSKGSALPEGFTFSCVPFLGFEPVVINCKLRAVIDGDKLTLTYRIMAKERMFNALSEEFKDLLKDQINGGLYIHLGEMDYQ
jgi:uncharacterized protein YfdQ (DUF2303 family)